MASLSYTTIGSNDPDRTKAFYDALLGPIGWKAIMDFPNGNRLYGDGASMFGVLVPYNGEAASSGNGSMIGFKFDTADEVNAFHAAALKLGARNEGDPGERMPGAYFAYVRDIDGNKLCAYAMGGA